MNGQATPNPAAPSSFNSATPSFSSPAGVRRPRALIFIHWITLILIALVVGIAFVREGIDEKAVRTVLINLHRSLGLAVALLAIVKEVARRHAADIVVEAGAGGVGTRFRVGFPRPVAIPG